MTLLTDDADNKRKAVEDGLHCLTVREFVEAQDHAVKGQLSDLLAASARSDERKSKRIYDEYLPPSAIQAGIKSGQLFQGHFNQNAFNYREVRTLTAVASHLG